MTHEQEEALLIAEAKGICQELGGTSDTYSDYIDLLEDRCFANEADPRAAMREEAAAILPYGNRPEDVHLIRSVVRPGSTWCYAP